jgi:hypothetical protein
MLILIRVNKEKVSGKTNLSSYEIYGEIGKNIILNCNFTEILKPAIIWYSPQNLIIENKTSISKYKISDNHLEIFSLKITDTGIYKCLAINELSSNYMQKKYGFINLIIFRPPLIFNKTKNFYVNDSSYVILDCVSNGVPKPVVSWYFNGKILDSKYIEIYPNGSLVIPNFKRHNAGIYTCNAFNSNKLLPAKLDYLGKLN